MEKPTSNEHHVMETINKIRLGTKDILEPYLYTFITNKVKCEIKEKLQRYINEMVSMYTYECSEYLYYMSLPPDVFPLTVRLNTDTDDIEIITVTAKMPMPYSRGVL